MPEMSKRLQRATRCLWNNEVLQPVMIKQLIRNRIVSAVCAVESSRMRCEWAAVSACDPSEERCPRAVNHKDGFEIVCSTLICLHHAARSWAQPRARTQGVLALVGVSEGNMASLDCMTIRGIRSFSDESAQLISFAKPLTVIVGANG
jgi:hypothetical protein